MATSRRKLYYDLRVSSQGWFTLSRPSGTTVVLVGVASTLAAFSPVSGADPATEVPARPDRYGNLMSPNQYTGVSVAVDPSGQMRTRQAIGAWFQCGSSNDTAHVRPCVDFVTASLGVPVGTAPSLDPATRRRSQVRLRFATPMTGAAQTDGTLYVQRQHSFEV